MPFVGPFTVQTFFSELLCKEAGLWEAIHAASDFFVDVSIYGDLGGKVVLLHGVVGEVCEFETHVLKAGHWGV